MRITVKDNLKDISKQLNKDLNQKEFNKIMARAMNYTGERTVNAERIEINNNKLNSLFESMFFLIIDIVIAIGVAIIAATAPNNMFVRMLPPNNIAPNKAVCIEVANIANITA